MNRSLQRVLHALCLSIAAGSCAAPPKTTNTDPRPNIAPTSVPEGGRELSLDASQIKPMFTELLPIDLPTAIRVAAAGNFDIQQARQEVEGSRGRLESTVGSVFPALVPTALFEHVEGTVRTAEGRLVGAGFNTFQPGLAIQWIVNPGRVVYEIVAAKKRFCASEQQERTIILETLRLSAVQYYALVLAQARVATAHESVTEAEELLRITQVRLRTGTGVEADELRGKARLAERRQELLQALNAFYESSIALSLTLHMDSSVTLVPKAEVIPSVQLVRDDIEIDDLLEFAVCYRPDLERVRTLVAAVAAEKGATWWGAFGPQFQTSYQYSGITGHAENVLPGEGIPNNLIVNPVAANGAFIANPLANGAFKEGILRGSKQLDGSRDQSFGFHDQQHAGAQVGWKFSVSAFGQMKSANAAQQQAILEADRRLDLVRAQVVSALQASRTNRELIEIADEQVVAARETLRLTETNLRVGTMTTLDVLQAEDAVTTARLRYADAVVHYNQSQVNLLASIGLLEEKSLTGQVDR